PTRSTRSSGPTMSSQARASGAGWPFQPKRSMSLFRAEGRWRSPIAKTRKGLPPGWLPGVPSAGARALLRDQFGGRTPTLEEHHGNAKARRKREQGRDVGAGGRPQGGGDGPAAEGTGVLLRDRQEGRPARP